LAVAAAALAAMARSTPTPPRAVDLLAGGAWVASSRVGLMTLIDGQSAQVAARVDVGGTPGPLAGAQAGQVAYALDGTRGTVVRVDPRTFHASRAAAVVARPSSHLTLRPTSRAVYVLDDDRGRVAVADPATLEVRRGADASLADRVGSSVVDDRGRLWLLGATTGRVTWFDGAERHQHAAGVRRPAGAELVLAGGRPALVDRTAMTVRLLGPRGPAGGRACLDLARDDDSLRFGGAASARLVYAVSGRQGVLRVSDLATGACGHVAVPVAAPGHVLGPPVETGGLVFVPDYTRGTVAVVDMASERVTVTPRPVASGPFDLFAEDGFVFYNEPASERAGVIHVDGTFSAVSKYDPAHPGAGLDGRDLAGPAPASRGRSSPTPDAREPGVRSPRDPEGPEAPRRAAGTRPRRPGEPVPGGTTVPTTGGGPGDPTTGDPGGPTVTPDPGTSPTTGGGPTTSDPGTTLPSPPTTPEPTNPPTTVNPCPGPDSDGDGIPDSCEPPDPTPPVARIDSVTRDTSSLLTAAIITVSGSDPDSGVRHVDISVISNAVCRGGNPMSDTLSDGADGNTLTVEAFEPCFSGPPTPLQVDITVTVTNALGATGTTREVFQCDPNGGCT
jgi:streptogramin lyase